MWRKGTLAAALFAFAPTLYAAEEQVTLAEAPQVVLVRANCSGCHSLDYVLMNSPFLKRAGWDAEVRKMIKVYGAPITDGDVEAIVEYLTSHYGAE
jgi:mono/diheme cytochrome c family protein